MSKKKHTAEEIVTKLREADVLVAKGQTIAEVCRHLAISDQTYYKWRKEYGGLQVDQAKRFKQLEHENTQLRKLVADLSMDNAILKEAAKRNW
jgi:transposase-like protein